MAPDVTFAAGELTIDEHYQSIDHCLARQLSQEAKPAAVIPQRNRVKHQNEAMRTESNCHFSSTGRYRAGTLSINVILRALDWSVKFDHIS